jgi:hypothetical protein
VIVRHFLNIGRGSAKKRENRQSKVLQSARNNEYKCVQKAKCSHNNFSISVMNIIKYEPRHSQYNKPDNNPEQEHQRANHECPSLLMIFS